MTMQTKTLMLVVIESMINKGNKALSKIKVVANIFAGRRMTPFFCQSITGWLSLG